MYTSPANVIYFIIYSLIIQLQVYKKCQESVNMVQKTDDVDEETEIIEMK